eukprot:12515332-Alexandrium_andersonii.AAC.1
MSTNVLRTGAPRSPGAGMREPRMQPSTCTRRHGSADLSDEPRLRPPQVDQLTCCSHSMRSARSLLKNCRVGVPSLDPDCSSISC